MVTDQDTFKVRNLAFEIFDDFPVSLNDWGFGFHEQKVGFEVFELF